MREDEILTLMNMYQDEQSIELFQVLELKLIHELNQQRVSLVGASHLLYDFAKR